ncbi:MarR family winged helix-turn-helix transcriptional regulator [Lysobacter solisilvae (ex Woo and Kim 2020)]|uniref:Winged helix-turn-helix transcriptional regulator n=1 Tax=Agrilutibacter terrestris TaxID=2865112 RepID=A0A7H0FVA8_9GAMM|nr:MarR family winged helix-turn-helix transcriptional regulator [Lysobacter terrestris]QNP39974.1 winged helix-turn-helix transcriptional regulator [Lysobacter terrestris]
MSTHPPAPPPGLCTCFRLRKLSRLVTQRYDRELAPAGLNVNQYSILRRASRGPRPIGALARELGMDRTTLSRDLKPLAAAGWIEFVAVASDGRQRCISVTAAGHAALDTAAPLWRQAQDAVEALLGSAGVGALHHHLDHAMQQLEDRPSA